MTKHANRKARVHAKANTQKANYTTALRADAATPQRPGRAVPQVHWYEWTTTGRSFHNPGCECGMNDAIVRIDETNYCLPGLLDDPKALQALEEWRAAVGNGEDNSCDECGAVTSAYTGLCYAHNPECSMYPGEAFFVEGTAVNAVVYYVETGDGERLGEDFASEDSARMAAMKHHERLIRKGLLIDGSSEPTELVDDFADTADGKISPRTCILTGEDGEDPDDCTTHEHEDSTENATRSGSGDGSDPREMWRALVADGTTEEGFESWLAGRQGTEPLTVTASSDGWQWNVDFDAAPYFAAASAHELQELIDSDFYPADRPAYELQGTNRDLASLLEHCSNTGDGIEVRIDKARLFGWLRRHRPGDLSELSLGELPSHLAEFFDVEIGNERFGGVTPATLASAADSWSQAGVDVAISWAKLGPYAATDAGRKVAAKRYEEISEELEALIAFYGEDRRLDDLY